MKAQLTLAPALLAVAALALGGCTDNNAVADGAIGVSSTADACTVDQQTTPGGTIRFDVTNNGSEVTEFYLLADDGLRIVGEVENIGPGLTRDLVVMVPEGSYYAACKPGMVGEGIRSAFTVTEAPAGQQISADRAELQQNAVDLYAAYVKDQTAQLVDGTREFAAAFAAGEAEAARALYPQVRMHWERIEPVAESFGDLDPILDAREADLEDGDAFTGWHRAEKDLWAPAGYTPMTAAERTALADKMVADTAELAGRTQELTFTADNLANGAKELLDEVATGKVTGEEEFFSHTDLWDFQANVEGARIAYEDLKPLLADSEPALDAALEENFAALSGLLDQYRAGEGFVLYTDLTPEQVQELSSAVDSLGEPLSTLTAAVVK